MRRSMMSSVSCSCSATRLLSFEAPYISSKLSNFRSKLSNQRLGEAEVVVLSAARHAPIITYSNTEGKSRS